MYKATQFAATSLISRAGWGLTKRWDCYLMQNKCSLIAGLAGKESTLNHIPPSLILTVTPLGPFSSPKLTTCETKQTQICDPHCEIISLLTMQPSDWLLLKGPHGNKRTPAFIIYLVYPPIVPYLLDQMPLSISHCSQIVTTPPDVLNKIVPALEY